jgi:glutamate synthase domain-containing protein 2
MTQEEATHQLDTLMAAWREQEDAAKEAAAQADAKKLALLGFMHEVGLKTHEGATGKTTISYRQKCDVVIDRKEFEAKLRQRGIYDQFTETKFSLSKVTDYVTKTGDDLSGMVEVSQTPVLTYTAKKEATA